jgi:hypothetical protein
VLRAGAGQVGSNARAVQLQLDGTGEDEEDLVASMRILVRSSARTQDVHDGVLVVEQEATELCGNGAGAEDDEETTPIVQPVEA